MQTEMLPFHRSPIGFVFVLFFFFSNLCATPTSAITAMTDNSIDRKKERKKKERKKGMAGQDRAERGEAGHGMGKGRGRGRIDVEVEIETEVEIEIDVETEVEDDVCKGRAEQGSAMRCGVGHGQFMAYCPFIAQTSMVMKGRVGQI